jgi:adenylosuccinate lyase
MRVWEEGKDFRTLLSQDEVIKRLLRPEELDSVFDAGSHLRHVEDIFRRVFGDA